MGDIGVSTFSVLSFIYSLANAILSGVLFFFDRPVICIFSREAELVQSASAVLPMFGLSFLPMALNLIYTAFLFSTKRTGPANAIALSRGIIVKSLAIFCIPVLFGRDAIWFAPLVAEAVTLALAVGLGKASRLVYK